MPLSLPAQPTALLSALVLALGPAQPPETPAAAVGVVGAAWDASHAGPAALCRADDRPAESALPVEHETPDGPELVRGKLGCTSAARLATARVARPAWLPRQASGRPVFAQLPLQILFCSWLD